MEETIKYVAFGVVVQIDKGLLKVLEEFDNRKEAEEYVDSNHIFYDRPMFIITRA